MLKELEVESIRSFTDRGQTIHASKLSKLCESHEVLRKNAQKYKSQVDVLLEILTRKTLTKYEQEIIKKICTD